MSKGHPRERQHMVFIDKWPLFEGYIALFNCIKVPKLCMYHYSSLILIDETMVQFNVSVIIHFKIQCICESLYGRVDLIRFDSTLPVHI